MFEPILFLLATRFALAAHPETGRTSLSQASPYANRLPAASAGLPGDLAGLIDAKRRAANRDFVMLCCIARNGAQGWGKPRPISEICRP
jgi:hypothetical protein